jgi:hypothetical protein
MQIKTPLRDGEVSSIFSTCAVPSCFCMQCIIRHEKRDHASDSITKRPNV